MIDTGDVNYAVGSGIELAINVNGNAIMGSAEEEDNVFAIADRLNQALADGDLEAISDELAQLDSRVDKLLAAQAGVGAKMNRVELMQNRERPEKVEARENKSEKQQPLFFLPRDEEEG